jgi:hypothetical protein
MVGAASSAGSDLSTQWPLVAGPLVIGLVAAGALYARGEPGTADEKWLRRAARIPNALERLTGIPGWAAAVVGVGLLHPVLSVIGFYTDVAWHIQFGRDKVLFTPPHTMIVLGLLLVPLSAAMGIVFATATRAPVGFRWGRWTVPWSVLPLIAFGFGALIGFPLDDLWHAFYGVDVTLWSPTHLMMVAAGGLGTISLWMVLRESRTDYARSGWSRAVFVVLAAATLLRLSAFQAEFDLGVPQFQLLFQPVIVTLAASAALVAARLALGRGGALITAAGFLVLRGLLALLVGSGLGYLVPRFPLYLASAVAVETVAAVAGTGRRLRFAALAGVGVATFGLAGEWWWSQTWSHHPWPDVLLPETAAVVPLAAMGAAVIGVVCGAFVAGRPSRIPARVLAAAAAVVVVALVIPSPRRAAPVEGQLSFERRGADAAVVQVALQPPGAAQDARWFEVVSWQGGGLRRSAMMRGADGVYRSPDAVPLAGEWKTVVRLHRGQDLLALPVHLPEDREIGAPAVPAVEGQRRFVADPDVMLREAKPGPAWPRLLVFGVLAAFVAVAASVVVLAGLRIERSGARRRSRPPSRAGHFPAGTVAT